MAKRIYGLFRNEANKRLIARLTSEGHELLLLAEPVCSAIAIPGTLKLSDFDWVIFPDLLSVDFLLAAIKDRYDLDALRICALGEVVSDRLRFSQLHADVIPTLITAENIFRSLSAYQPPKSLNFLIPCRAATIMEVGELLAQNGANVTVQPIYTTGEIPDLARVRTLLAYGAVDEFIFTSPQDIYSFTEIEREKIEFNTSATDEITLQTLKEFGFSPFIYK